MLLQEDLPFGKNSGSMLDAGPQMLVGVAAVLQRHPYVSILVDGHSKGKKNTPFLQKLSEKRAFPHTHFPNTSFNWFTKSAL